MHALYSTAYIPFTSWMKFTLNLTRNSFLPWAAWSPQQPLISSCWFWISARGLAHSNRIPARPFWFSWDVGWSLKIVPSLKISQKKVISATAVIFIAAAEGSSLPFILLELLVAAADLTKLGVERWCVLCLLHLYYRKTENERTFNRKDVILTVEKNERNQKIKRVVLILVNSTSKQSKRKIVEHVWCSR